MNRAQHPILRWLPLKLAKWIGDNYGPRLASCWNLPSKSRRQEDSLTQNVAQLNAILEHNLILSTKDHLQTFGFSGSAMVRPKARCYPFDLQKHRLLEKILS